MPWPHSRLPATVERALSAACFRVCWWGRGGAAAAAKIDNTDDRLPRHPGTVVRVIHESGGKTGMNLRS
jgi:hypothetical protein